MYGLWSLLLSLVSYFFLFSKIFPKISEISFDSNCILENDLDIF
jgi:hypothetical protein